MEYHPCVQKIIDLISSHGFWFETFEHESVLTSQQAASLRIGYSLHQGAKALILKMADTKEKLFVMVVVPGDKKFSNSKLKAILHTRNIQFATEEQIDEITQGIRIGGIPPFGTLFHLPVYCDTSVVENEKIIFNAGDRQFSIAMKSNDYVSLVHPVIVDVVA